MRYLTTSLVAAAVTAWAATAATIASADPGDDPGKATAAWAGPDASATGPGIPPITFSDDQLFEPLASINKTLRAPRGHVLTTMHRGYLVVVGARDGGGGKGSGGFAFFDISDPAAPKCVFSRFGDPVVGSLGEAHAYGVARMPVDGEDRDIAALLDNRGIQLWDWTDPTAAEHLATLKLDGLRGGDYSNTAWWLAFQAPYVWVGGTGSGIHLIDVGDPRAPRPVARTPTGQTGGFKAGPIFACGNTLVVSDMDSARFRLATLDIADPGNPMLLATLDDKAHGAVYSTLFNGGRLYLIANHPRVVDLADPFEPVYHRLAKQDGKAKKAKKTGKTQGGGKPKQNEPPSADSDFAGKKGGYAVVQDGFLMMGASSGFAKVDVTDPARPVVVRTVRFGGDRDGAGVLGHLAVSSDDHGKGSTLFPHQPEPDTTPPAPNFFSPADGEVDVPTTSRVGVTFTDQIDLRSLTRETLTLRPVGGDPVPGVYSTQVGIVNFSPTDPLRPGTEYEMLIRAGGVRDLAGNAVAAPRRIRFTTAGDG